MQFNAIFYIQSNAFGSFYAIVFVSAMQSFFLCLFQLNSEVRQEHLITHDLTARKFSHIPLPYLSSEWSNNFSFLLECETLGLLLWLDSIIWGNYRTTFFNKQLPRAFFMHRSHMLCVSGNDIGLNKSLRIVFLTENDIIFVMIWKIIMS